jgi:hypothetical protein
MRTTDYITSSGSTPYINISCGTLHGDTLSLFLFPLFLEPLLLWLTVGSRGYRPGAPTIHIDPIEPTATYPGQGLTGDLGLAMGSPTNLTTKLQKLSLFCVYKYTIVNVRTFCFAGAL